MDGTFLVAVAFVIEHDDKVLLLRRSLSKDHAPGEWEVGSGRVKQGESPLEAVLREAREETGLEVDVVRPLDTFHFYRGTAQVETIGITFHCRAARGEVELSAEHDESQWVPIERLHVLDCGDWMRRSFKALLANRNQQGER